MRIKPGCEEECRIRHENIWPELSALLRDAGIVEYTIFLDRETGTLFALQKLTEDHRTDSLAETVVMRRWWDYMADLMAESHSDGSPVCTGLTEVFHLE